MLSRIRVAVNDRIWRDVIEFVAAIASFNGIDGTDGTDGFNDIDGIDRFTGINQTEVKVTLIGSCRDVGICALAAAVGARGTHP
ncbi:MAG TPA: hypothetical protein VGN32_17000, partial [Ktedonobacterales bacterium]|nr:hypothetical protein [Ktedonobacterales bacterium]